MLMRLFLKSTAIVLALLFTPQVIAGSELATLDVRPGVTMKMMILEPNSNPKGVLVLYAGGVGTLELGSFFGNPTIGNKSYATNFLVRVREKFVDSGYVAILPDVPSDRAKMDYIYRLGNDQIIDARATISFLKKRYKVPIWLVGTSASSLTVAHSAADLSDQISGIILTASVTRVPSNYAVYSAFPEGTASTNLSTLKIPALVITNSEDACNLSPPGDTELIKNRLTASPRVATKYFSGGDSPRSGPCDALSRHGFLGIENDVIDEMLKFISAP